METKLYLLKDTPFNDLLSLKEAADIWGVDESSIRKAITTGRRFRYGEDCRKFGKQWVVTVRAMLREYSWGKIKSRPDWNRYLEQLQQDDIDAERMY